MDNSTKLRGEKTSSPLSLSRSLLKSKIFFARDKPLQSRTGVFPPRKSPEPGAYFKESAPDEENAAFPRPTSRLLYGEFGYSRCTCITESTHPYAFVVWFLY